MSDSESVPENNTMADFLSLVQDDAAIASLLFAQSSSKSSKQSKKDASTTKREHQTLLLGVCQHLFKSIEQLSQTLQKVDSGNANDENINATSLSGLDELYLGDQDDDDDDETPVDAETVWGQVDLQNEALHAILKKSVKKLGIAASGNDGDGSGATTIRLLDIESEILNDEEDGDNNSDEDNQEEEDSEEEEAIGEKEGNDSDEDEMTRRMRDRMERALQSDDEDDMGGSGDDDDDGEEYEDTRFFGAKKKKSGKSSSQTNNSTNQEKKDEFEGLVDPAAEELNNGFFDINEMEAFADEEEDMLPEDIWDLTPATPKKKQDNTKSFHQRQRDGIDDDNEAEDDDDDDDDEDMMEMKLENAKRKKYREDDEVEALHSMYGTSKMEDDDEDDYDDDAVNMTAADLFGKPDKKYFHKWKAQQKPNDKGPKSTKKTNTKKDDDDDDDVDSWDGYKFDDAEADWGASKEEEGKDNAGKSGAGSDSDADSDSGESNGSDGDDGEDDEDQETTKKSKDPAKLSRHERQSEKLQAETQRLEKEMIGAKPWQMVGEASATARPVNSLLDGAPEFQVASKIAPLITEEHTADLEEVIKRRILAEDWDEVIPRELPDVAWNKKRGELTEVSQEKAKLGLGELYEREYLKKAVGYDVDAAEKQSEEDKAKNEMKQLFANVCSKLDALSNYHFAPRPVADEAEVRPATTPAIAMEEVLPLHVSDARGAAPEEVYGKKRGRDGILRSETELEQVNISLRSLSCRFVWLCLFTVCSLCRACLIFFCHLRKQRPKENVSVVPRRQRVANLAKRRLPTKSLFPGSNLVLGSTTPTKNARREKKYPWRGPKEESRTAKWTSILDMVPVSSSSRSCKTKFRKPCMVNEPLKLTRRKSREPKSQAHLRCKGTDLFFHVLIYYFLFCQFEASALHRQTRFV